jgi:ABC-2 type transport system ATP-binding protein
LKAAVGAKSLHVAVADPARLDEAAGLLERHLGHAVRRSEGGVLSIVAETPKAASDVLAALIAANIELADFSIGSPSLDEVFFAMTGKPAEASVEAAS